MCFFWLTRPIISSQRQCWSSGFWDETRCFVCFFGWTLWRKNLIFTESYLHLIGTYWNNVMRIENRNLLWRFITCYLYAHIHSYPAFLLHLWMISLRQMVASVPSSRCQQVSRLEALLAPFPIPCWTQRHLTMMMQQACLLEGKSRASPLMAVGVDGTAGRGAT